MTRFGSGLPSSIKVSFPTDEKGMTGRECPNKECLGYFKVQFGTGLKESDLPCFCPYCGHKGPHNTFFTPEQLKYAKSVAVREFSEAIRKEMKKLEFDIKRQGMFGIGMSMKVTPGKKHPIHYYREKELETDVTCSQCTLHYAIYGVFAFCPDCSQHNSLQILDKNFEVIEKMLKMAATAEAELAERLIENALEDCVSAFDGFGREICSVYAQKATNADQARKISFQNLESAKVRVADLFGFDLSSDMPPADWKAAIRSFQKRHLFAHTMGVIDDDYVAKSFDSSAVVGRKVSLNSDEVHTVLPLLRKIAKQLSAHLST